jgi:ABC-type uncharacterized transport system permease subunit
MVGILWASFLLSAGSYLAACALFVAQARRRPATAVGPGWAPRLLGIGATLQLGYLVLFSVMDRRCPVYSLYSAVNILSLVGVVTFAVVRRGRRLEALGAVVASLAAVFLGVSHAIAAPPAAPDDRWLMAFHITTNFLGGGVLLVAGCASALYLWSEHRLRRRRALGALARLPPLESLDTVVHRLLWLGVPLLTVGILTGRMVIRHVAAVTTGDQVRALLSIGSWLLLLVVLGLRQFARWRGRRPAYAALAGSLGILVVIALYIARAMFGRG